MIVANVRELQAISHSDRKSDQVDAEKLARFARLDPKILGAHCAPHSRSARGPHADPRPPYHVRLRTAAVNAVRGVGKALRISASSFIHALLRQAMPGRAAVEALARALGPVLHQIADMTVKIKQYDRAIKQLTETEYPETQALLKVYGVGQLTGTDVCPDSGKQRTVPAKS